MRDIFRIECIKNLCSSDFQVQKKKIQTAREKVMTSKYPKVVPLKRAPLYYLAPPWFSTNYALANYEAKTAGSEMKAV